MSEGDAPPAAGRGGVSRSGADDGVPWGPGSLGWWVADGAVAIGLLVALYGLFQLMVLGTGADQGTAFVLLGIGFPLTTWMFTRVVEVSDRAFIGRVLLAGLLLRVGLGLIIHFRLPIGTFAPDQFTFQDVGWRTLLHLEGRGPRPLQIDGTLEVGYFYWNALLFKLFGFVPLAPKLVNVFLGAWTGLIAYRLGGEVGGKAGARGAAAFTLLMPSLILWSTQNLREAPVTLLNSYLLLGMVRLHVRPRVATLGLVLAALATLGVLRDYMAWMAALALVGSLVLARGQSPVYRVALAGFIVLVWSVAYANLGFGADLIQTANFESIDAQRRALAFGGSAFAPDADLSTPLRGFTFLPMGVLFFLFAPFPWQVGTSALTTMAFPETLLWYGLVAFAAIGGWHLLRRRFARAIPSVLFLMLTVAVYGLIEGNAGTAYRHRSQLIVAVFVFASVGLELIRVRRLRSRG